jgi:hypothetical protein
MLFSIIFKNGRNFKSPICFLKKDFVLCQNYFQVHYYKQFFLIQNLKFRNFRFKFFHVKTFAVFELANTIKFMISFRSRYHHASVLLLLQRTVHNRPSPFSTVPDRWLLFGLYSYSFSLFFFWISKVFPGKVTPKIYA